MGPTYKARLHAGRELLASASTAWASAEDESLEGTYPGGGIQLLDSALKTCANVSAYFKRSRKKVHMTVGLACCTAIQMHNILLPRVPWVEHAHYGGQW
eukprot:6175631-Pleurochrysis_carterae.AAC.1